MLKIPQLNLAAAMLAMPLFSHAGDESTVSIATGSSQFLLRASSTATTYSF